MLKKLLKRHCSSKPVSCAYTNLRFKSENSDISMIKSDISSFISNLKRNYILKFEGGTVANCLASHETGVNHVVTAST